MTGRYMTSHTLFVTLRFVLVLLTAPMLAVSQTSFIPDVEGAISAQGETIRISVPVGERSVRVTLRDVVILTPDAVVVEGTADGDRHVLAPRYRHGVGHIDGDSTSFVVMTVFEDCMYGYLEFGTGSSRRRYVVVPSDKSIKPVALHVSYEDLGQGRPSTCGSETFGDYDQRTEDVFRALREQSSRPKLEDRTQAETSYELRLAVDCSNSFYQKAGLNVRTTAAYALALVGACSAVFERDAGIRVVVPYLRVWIVSDPFPGEIGAALGSLRTYWADSMKHVQRSTTTLLSTSVGGGLAWVGTLCGDYGFNVSGIGADVSFPQNGYIWDIDVTSHELGHNIGSSHTHNCGWSPPIDSCWNAEGGCYDFSRPRRGTIMSYCHLQNTGTELALHPRTASLMRSVMTWRTCIGQSTPRHDTDAVLVSIPSPEAGAVIRPELGIRPSVVVRNTGRTAVTGTFRTTVRTIRDSVLVTMTSQLAPLGVGETRRQSLPDIAAPSIPGTYHVRVELIVNGDNDVSSNVLSRPFVVSTPSMRTITVTRPSTAAPLVSGSTAVVSWTASSDGPVTVDYSTDDGETWATIRSRTGPTVRAIDWLVPTTPTSRGRVRVTSVTDASVRDICDVAFPIIVDKDVAVEEIVVPRENDTTASPLLPRIIVRNRGVSRLRDVRVRCSLTWVHGSSPVYDTTIVVTLQASQTDTIVFPVTAVLPTGKHIVRAEVEHPEDVDTTNNRMGREVRTFGTGAPYAIRAEAGPGRVIVSWKVDGGSATLRTEILRVLNGDTVALDTVARTIGTIVDDDYDTTVRTYLVRTYDAGRTSQLFSSRPTAPWFEADTNVLERPTVLSPRHTSFGIPFPVTAVWSTSVHAHRYHIQVGTTASFDELIQNIITYSPGIEKLNLDAGASVWWRVRMLSSRETGMWSTPQNFSLTPTCAGSALNFLTGDHRAVDSTFEWDGGPVTIEWWQYVPRSGVRASSAFAIGSIDNVNNRLQAHVPWDDNVVYWDYGSTSNGGRLTAFYGNYTDKWTHVALVSDGSSFQAIYLDGQLVSSATRAGQAKGLKGLWIGSMRNQLGARSLIDEFRIWSRVRSADEILAGMSSRRPTASNDPSLIAQWHMNEGQGAVATDTVRRRRLRLSVDTMWASSEAPLPCVERTSLPSTAVVPTRAALDTTMRERRLAVEWPQISGSEWYEVDVTTATPQWSRRIMTGDNWVEIDGVPAASRATVRVRAMSSRSIGALSSTDVVTTVPCDSTVVEFRGRTAFVDTVLHVDGRAMTVEYWAFVDTSDVRNGSVYHVGRIDNEIRRYQAHAPWSDGKIYHDFGSWREAGRLTADYPRYGQWHHFALTSNGLDTMTIVINGVVVARSSFADAPGVLRGFGIGGNVPSQYHFAGKMADFRIWDVALSEEQVRSSMYTRLANRRSGLLVSVLFDEGAGSAASSYADDTTIVRSTDQGLWSRHQRNIGHVIPDIDGPTNIRAGLTASYRSRGRAGLQHQWVVEGGSIIGDATGSNITVEWTSDSGRIHVVRTWPGGCRDSSSLTTRFQSLVTVTESDVEPTLRVIPHPVVGSGRIVISRALAGTDIGTITVSDVTGRTIYSEDLQGRRDLELPRLTHGTYVVILRTRTSITTQTFVVGRE